MKQRDVLSALACRGAAGSSQPRGAETSGPGDQDWRAARSDHFDGRRFFNPQGPTGASFRDFLRWRTSRRGGIWPERVNDNVPAVIPGRIGEREAVVTAVNHCTFLIQLPGCNLLTDPVYSERVSPVSFAGPRRIRPPGIAWDRLPRIDAVVVSHSHYDHLDLPTLEALHRRFRPRFITGLGNRALLEQRGIGPVDELDWWQATAVGELGVQLTYTPAQHWSSRSLLVKNTSLWGGFWIASAQRRIYFAGDSGYGRDFATIRGRLGVPDLALLPIGAYEPRWFMHPFHLAPDEAIRARSDLGAPRCLAMHFDTFPLADEAYGAAERELAAARAGEGLAADQFHAPRAGETVLVG